MFSYFVLFASQSWTLGKVVGHRETLDPLIQTACQLVDRDSFGRTAAELGLLSTATQELPADDQVRPDSQAAGVSRAHSLTHSKPGNI